MAVEIYGYPYAAVAKTLRHNPGMDVLPHEQRRVGVAQVMETETLQARALRRLPEGVREPVRGHRPPAGPAEHQGPGAHRPTHSRASSRHSPRTSTAWPVSSTDRPRLDFGGMTCISPLPSRTKARRTERRPPSKSRSPHLSPKISERLSTTVADLEGIGFQATKEC